MTADKCSHSNRLKKSKQGFTPRWSERRGVILSAEDEKSLKTTAITAAKAIDGVKKYKGIAKAAYEVIRDIVQAVGLLKFNFKGDYKPSNNLMPEQDILIATILNHGLEISKNHGYSALADEMKKAKMSKPISEIFNRLEEDYRKINRPSFDETFEAAKLKSQEQNKQNNNAHNISQGHKNRGGER